MTEKDNRLAGLGTIAGAVLLALALIIILVARSMGPPPETYYQWLTCQQQQIAAHYNPVSDPNPELACGPPPAGG